MPRLMLQWDSGTPKARRWATTSPSSWTPWTNTPLALGPGRHGSQTSQHLVLPNRGSPPVRGSRRPGRHSAPGRRPSAGHAPPPRPIFSSRSTCRSTSMRRSASKDAQAFEQALEHLAVVEVDLQRADLQFAEEGVRSPGGWCPSCAGRRSAAAGAVPWCREGCREMSQSHPKSVARLRPGGSEFPRPQPRYTRTI